MVLPDRCRFMIGHDSEHPVYRYAEAFQQFRYRFIDSRRFPWTTVVSNEPLDWLADALQFPGVLAWSWLHSAGDVRTLAVFLEAIREAQTLDRHSVRDRAVEQFGTDRVVHRIINAVNAARLVGVSPRL